MSLYWKCECGEEFEELGVKEPGNDLGWRKAVDHVRTHRRNKEPEKMLGLFDSKTGEMVFEGGMRPLAVKQGIIPGKPVNEKETMSISEMLEKRFGIHDEYSKILKELGIDAGSMPQKVESEKNIKLLQGILEMHYAQQKLLIEVIIKLQSQMCELQRELIREFLSLH